MNYRVAVIGSLNADLSVGVERHPRPGETLLGTGGNLTPGGKGGNQALAAARQGARTLMIGAIGTDSHGETATSLLREAGVDLRHVATVPGPTGLAIVAVDRHGENNIIVVPGANSELSKNHIAAAEADLARCGIAVIQAEIPVDTIAYASEVLERIGVRQILNLAPVVSIPAEVLKRSDPLVVNEHEASEILASSRSPKLAATPEGPVDGAKLAAALVNCGVRSAVVTMGSAGAVLATSGGTILIPAPQVKATDTTGAGDAFVGALASSLAEGNDLAFACRHATQVAAFSVQGHGAQMSYPTKADLSVETP
jgi:ribokinase